MRQARRIRRSPPVRAVPRGGRGAACSARISAARSSSRTASSASIASCFISGATSCPENLAQENSAVKREVAGPAHVEVGEDALEVLVRRLGRAARKPVGRERAFHAGVGGDHGPARVRLGPEVVERLVEHVGERGKERLRQWRRACRRRAGGRDTSATTAIATSATTTAPGPGANCGW